MLSALQTPGAWTGITRVPLASLCLLSVTRSTGNVRCLKNKWHYTVVYALRELLELELKCCPLFFMYRFVYVEFGHHGSDCDGGIFSRSRLLEQLEVYLYTRGIEVY